MTRSLRSEVKYDHLPLSENVEDRRAGTTRPGRTLLEQEHVASDPSTKLSRDAGVDDIVHKGFLGLVRVCVATLKSGYKNRWTL
jgi:hypothetical protein